MKQLILASQSPRRKDLLSQLGYQFVTQPADIDESVQPNENAENYVLRLAKEKAQAIFINLSEQEQTDVVVVGSDTSVVIDGDILGKPRDEADCIATLLRLENKRHQVLNPINKKIIITSKLVETQVYFKALTVNEIKCYWNTGEPCDKAGSYAIQGIGGQFIIAINGSYSAVVGLPLYETSQLLAQVGLPSSLS